jgi:post-segregation antitoxin (ccd killing protein)
MQSWAIKQGRKGRYREKLDVRLPFEVMSELRKRARLQGITVSDLVRLYIQQAIEKTKGV